MLGEQRLLSAHRGLQTVAADAGQAQVAPDVCIHRMPVAHDVAAEGAKGLGGLVTRYREAAEDVGSEEWGQYLGNLRKTHQTPAP